MVAEGYETGLAGTYSVARVAFVRSHSCKAFYSTIISKQTFHLASFPCLPTVQFLITFGATGNEANIHPGIKTIALKPPIKYGTQPGKVYIATSEFPSQTAKLQ